jgi:hypothetical protein
MYKIEGKAFMAKVNFLSPFSSDPFLGRNLKGTLTRDFLLQFFLANQLSPGHNYTIGDVLICFLSKVQRHNVHRTQAEINLLPVPAMKHL